MRGTSFNVLFAVAVALTNGASGRAAPASSSGKPTSASTSTSTSASKSTSTSTSTRPATTVEDPDAMRFVYSLDPGTEFLCPDEEMLKNAVGARLGYMPFHDDGGRILHARVERTKQGLRGQVRLFDAKGELAGSREIDGAGNDCLELSRALELAISIAIDPRAIMRPSPPLLPDEEGPPRPDHLRDDVTATADRKRGMPVDTTPPPTGTVTVSPVEVVRVWNTDGPLLEGPPVPDDLAARQRQIGRLEGENAARDFAADGADDAVTTTDIDTPWVSYRLTAGALLTVGTAPGPAIGNHVGAMVFIKRIGFALEYQRNLPSTGGFLNGFFDDGDNVWSDLRTVTASVCATHDWVFGCAGLGVGLQTFAANGLWLPEQFRPYAGAAGRVGLDLPILWFIPQVADLIRLRVHTDVTTPFFYWHVRRPPNHSDRPTELLWVVPPVGFQVGAALVIVLS